MTRAVADAAPSLFGHGSQFIYFRSPRQIASTPVLTFQEQRIDLAEPSGAWTLVNIWASWCSPCVAELPSLDHLQHRLAGEGLRIVAVSIDGMGSMRARELARRLELRRMTLAFDGAAFADHGGALAAAAGGLAIYALPISYLLDPLGRAVGYFPGAAEWDSPPAVTFLRQFLRKDRR